MTHTKITSKNTLRPIDGELLATDKPLVYSCSGCSNVAQLANDIAVTMDREGAAEMSCIAGVGGNVKKLVKVAQSGRPILAIDGCRLACVKNTLAGKGVEPTWYLELTELGLRKRHGEHCTFADGYRALKEAYGCINHVPPDENVVKRRMHLRVDH